MDIIQDIISTTLKRVMDDQESNSNTSKRTNPNRTGQKAFVERLTKRDKKCPILNTPAGRCEGAHIVGWDYWNENQVIYYSKLGYLGV
jgi:hypothetical protein